MKTWSIKHKLLSPYKMSIIFPMYHILLLYMYDNQLVGVLYGVRLYIKVDNCGKISNIYLKCYDVFP